MMARVLFFGAIADITGVRTIEVGLDVGSTAATILEKLLAEYPGMNTYKLKISVNQAYASGAVVLQDGDEIAIFTAVSGG